MRNFLFYFVMRYGKRNRVCLMGFFFVARQKKLFIFNVMDHLDQSAYREWQSQQDKEEASEDQKTLGNLDPQTVVAIFLIVTAPTETGAFSWKTALRRLAVLAHHILPDIGRYSLQSLADELTKAGVDTTRAALSDINVQICQQTGFRRTEKSEAAREAYRARAKRVWKRRKGD